MLSGSGSNMQAIAEAITAGHLHAEIGLVISNKANAYALERCKALNLPAVVVPSKEYASPAEFEKAIADMITTHNIDLICLAGFMKLLSPDFVDRFNGKIINIHPSLLPAFPGLNAIGQAFEYGAKVTGVTIHFVDAGCDTGAIIAQEATAILDSDNEKSLAKRIHAIEHQLYPKVIQLIVENKVTFSGRRVLIRS